MATVTVVHKTEAEKKLKVQLLLGNMIVQNDPKNRSIALFAKRVGVSRQYVYRCIESGFCPSPMVTKLQREFGKAAAPMEELCWSKLDN